MCFFIHSFLINYLWSLVEILYLPQHFFFILAMWRMIVQKYVKYFVKIHRNCALKFFVSQRIKQNNGRFGCCSIPTLTMLVFLLRTPNFYSLLVKKELCRNLLRNKKHAKSNATQQSMPLQGSFCCSKPGSQKFPVSILVLFEKQGNAHLIMNSLPLHWIEHFFQSNLNPNQ